MRLALLIAVSITLPCAAPRAQAQDVTIYRCIAANGKLTLRDSPCTKGETQEVRSMQRPRDPAPSPAAPAKPAAPLAPPPSREVQVIYRVPPRPLYECVAADGKRYTSENGDGNPRFVPLWTLGYPLWSHRSHGGGGHSAPRPPEGRPDGSGRPPSRPGLAYPAGGTWVRDECHPLPQEEVCARLSDRRYEIMRRYNSAMQSERRQLDLEQRGLDARLSNDCGIN